MDFNGGYIADAIQPEYLTSDKTILDFVNPFEGIVTPSIIGNTSGSGDVVGDAFSKFASKSSSDTANATPEFFDYKANADRYTNSAYYKELGFDPYADNETKYGNRQTWGNTIGNALGGGSKLAAQTFISGWKGWGDMANALFSWDYNKLTGSPDELLELSNDQNEIMNKYAIYQTPESEESVFNRQFLGNMLQQGGFAVGALAQFATEELLTAGLASGLGLGKATITGGRFLSKTVETGELLNDAKKLGDIWKSENLVQGLLKGAKRLVPLAETTEEIAKSYKAGAGALQLASIGAGGIKRALAEANMAFTESRMEAAGTYGDLYNKLSNEYIRTNGQAPVGDDLNKIRDTAQQAAGDNFKINAGILLVSNRIQFDNLFSKFGADRRIIKEVGELGEKVIKVTGKIGGEETTRLYEKGILGAAGKYSQIAADFGKRTAAWEAIKGSKGLLKFEVAEGIQEVLQDLSNNTMQDYYYDLYHGAKGYSKGRSLDRAIEKEKSNQGLQTFLMGALTGALLSPMTHGIELGVDRLRISGEQRAQNAADKTNAINTLNAFYSDPNIFLKEGIATLKVQEAAADKMQEALKNRDRYTYNNQKDSAFSDLVSAAIKTNSLPSLLDTMRGYADHITPEQFKEHTGLDPVEDNIKDTRTYFNNIADSIESFSKNYEALNDKYGDLVIPELYKNGSVGQLQALVAKKALDDAIQVLATNRYKSEQALLRAQEIYRDLSKNKSIATSSAEAFTTLGSINEVTKQVGLLKEELKGLNDNPVKNDQINQIIAQKQAELNSLNKWKETYQVWNDTQNPLDRYKLADAMEAYKDYINAKNKQYNLSSVISNDDIQDTFHNLADYTVLNDDHEAFIQAYNVLANPQRFVVYHGKLMDAINNVREKFLAEQTSEVEANDGPKESFTLTGKDDEGQDYSIDIEEGQTYVTKADEKKNVFKGQIAKTFNNNIIEVVKIDGDNITIKVNNDKTYIVPKSRLEDAGKLWNLNDMSIDERIYFKNRDKIIKFNVSGKYGKPHSITGKYADKDYSKSGRVVNGRLILVKEDGKNSLKIQYVNPVTKKTVSIDYNRVYLEKYGIGTTDLRGLPTELEEQDRVSSERRKKNYDTQLKIFTDRLDDANAQLDQALVNRDTNAQKFEELRTDLQDNRVHLELVTEELDKYIGKPGRKSKVRLALEQAKTELTDSINNAQAHIDNIKAERENLTNTIEALKQARSFYEDAALELMDIENPYDRNGNASLSTEDQSQFDSLNKSQITTRFDADQVDSMIDDTQNEVDTITSQINHLEGYIKDIKDILSRITNLSDFIDFNDLPQNVENRSSLREYLRKKIADETDPDKKDEYQKLMNQVLKGGKDVSDILFFLSSLRDSYKNLDDLQAQLQADTDKLERLKQAKQEKGILSDLQSRIDFLNQVQDVLTQDAGKVIRETQNAIPPVSNTEPVDQEGLSSDIMINPDPKSATYTFQDRKPKFEEVLFNKTFGRQYLDDNDTEINTKNGTERFYAFTAKQNVLNQGYQLQVVTEHNDEFGIRQSDLNPNDIKVVLVKKVGDNYKYIDQNGKEIDEPNADNIVYRSLTNIGAQSPKTVRDNYTVAPTTTDEMIQAKIDEHKAYQNSLVERTKSGPVYLNAVSASSGIQRIEYLESVGEDGKKEVAKASAEGRVIVDSPDWNDLKSANNPEVNIELRVATSNGSIAPGILAGRAVMQEYTVNDVSNKVWGDKVTRVFNRLLDQTEKDKVISSLIRMTSLFGKNRSEQEDAELNIINNYIKNVIPWGKSDNPNTDKFFYVEKGLHKGIQVIPFTAKSIQDNAEQLLVDVYHNVNNNTLSKNEEFTDIEIKDGKIVPGKTYRTYQEYLLSQKGDQIPPVYTSLPRIDSGITQRTGAYLNWSDPDVQVEKVEYTPAPKAEKPQVDPNERELQRLQNELAVAKGFFNRKDIEGRIELLKSKITEKSPEDKKVTTEQPEKKSASSILSRIAKPEVEIEEQVLAKNEELNPTSTQVSNAIPTVGEGDNIKTISIEDAVANAKPKVGQLSATVFGAYNPVTGEYGLPFSATVNIPDGNLKAAQKLLGDALKRQIPNDDEEAPFRLTFSQLEKTEDFGKLKEFMDKNLPQIPVNKVGELIAGKAWGQFKNGAIYIYDNAEIGTGFHEAFEGVWASYLNNEEQDNLRKEFRSRTGQFTNPFTQETKDHSQASDYDVREMLAEEFRNFVLDGDVTSFGKKTQGIFTRLWNFIKNLLGLGEQQTRDLNDNINSVFKNITTGGFKGIKSIRELASELPVFRAVGNLSQDETGAAVEGLAYYFFIDLYSKGNNIDSLLNDLDPVANNKLLNDLYNTAHNNVVADASKIGPVITAEIQANKDGLYNEFKKFISKFGLDVDESDNILTKEENTTDGLGIRDSIKIDPKKMTVTNMKLLLASMPQTEYKETNKGIKVIPIRNIAVNAPRLIDYEKTHNLILNELSNIVTTYNEDGTQNSSIDQMFIKLDNKYKYKTGFYKPGYLWVQNLKLRLKYEDKEGNKTPIESLSPDDINIRIAFIKSFTNVKTTPQKTIVGEDGYVYSLNPVEGINIDRVRDTWANNLKQDLLSNVNKSKLITLDNKGLMIINRDSAEYRNLISNLDNRASITPDNIINILSQLGIIFSETRDELAKSEATLRGEAIQILEQIKNGSINTITDLYGSNIVGGRINSLLGIEAEFTGEDNILSYMNASGESQYSVGIPSLLSNSINILNSVKSLKELVITAPWLGKVENGEVVLFPYQRNSELLKPGGTLFDLKGNRKTGKIGYQVISGIGTSDYDGTSTDALQYPERLANKIHYLLGDKKHENAVVFSNINSDKSTEFGISIPGKHIVSKDDVTNFLFFNNPKILDIYKTQLLDEMAAALYNKINPSNVQYYKDSVSSLGHFRDILGTELVDEFKKEVLSVGASYTGSYAHQNFLDTNQVKIDEAITKYLNEQVDQTVKTLKDLDIFTKYALIGNDLYITDAIDNSNLIGLLKITGQKIVVGEGEDHEKIERQGFTESDLKTLAGFLAFNEEALITEQHKLIYGHPAFYKDLPKRANGATSTKEQLVDDPNVILWADQHMSRNDGKVRSSEAQQTLKHISYKDQDVISDYNLNIAEGIYKDLIDAGVEKSKAEIKTGAKFNDDHTILGFITKKDKDGNNVHTGLIKPYLELNEADAQAWVMPDFARDTLFFTGKLTKGQDKQFDYEIAYEKLALSKLGYQQYTDKELQAAEKLVAKGDPSFIFQVQKTQGFGFAVDNNYTHPVFLKHSVQPKFYRHVEGTQWEKLYLAAKKDQVDIIGFESGEKVGNVLNKDNEFTKIYNDKGELNIQNLKGQYTLPKGLAQQKMYTKFYGIQVETSSKPKQTVVRGTQVSKLIMLNFYENGKPLNENVAKLVENYNTALKDMLNLSKSELLNELGLSKDSQGNYQTEDLSNLVKVLRKEAENRGMPDNMIQGIDSILGQDGRQTLKYKFDTLINREKIDNILNSIVDSRVISEKINGKASVQVASTLFESNPRNFLYLKDGKYQELNKKDIKNLSDDEKKSVKMKSSDLKFYHKKDGKIQDMEVYITWPFKGIEPESLGLVLENGIYKASGKIDKRLLSSIGFRIPTQAMNSIESITVKGFTPIANGDMVVVPSEMVGKSGSDFDIDKLNMYLINHYFNPETKSLDFIEYKGSVENTRKYYEEQYDKGKLFGKGQYGEYQQYVNDWFNLANEKYSDSKLVKSLFPNQFQNPASVEDLTRDFIEDLNSEEDNKKSIVDSFVKKALQNHFMNSMKALITDESNYGQLVLPNSTETIKTLADEISKWKVAAGTKSKQNEKSPTYLRTFTGSNQIRERYLTAKRMVGIAALQGTFHSLAQVAGLQISKTFAIKSMYYLANENEKIRQINIKLNHNPLAENGNFDIGHKNDVDGNSISDIGSQKLSGFVDGAKDPFVFDLNLSLNTATTSYYFDHHGVSVEDSSYFMNQPVLDQYFDEFAKNRSGFKKINGTSLTREQLFYKTIAPYYKRITGEDINKVIGDLMRVKGSQRRVKAVKQNYVTEFNKIANEFDKFSREELIQGIKSGYGADPKLQIAVLMNYLEMNTQAQLLNNYISAIGYDNKKTKSIQENQMQVARWNKTVKEGFIANPNAILDKTFLGTMKEHKEDVFNMYKQFFISMSPSVQKVFEPMENKISNPDFFSTQDDQYQLLNRYQNFVVTYLMHTTEFKEGDKTLTLNTLYDEMFRGKDSMAKTLATLKKSANPFISENLIVQELLPIMNEDTSKTDNISLFRNKIDTYKINNLIEALDNLRDYAIEIADNNLLDFTNNLAKFSILQSGAQSSTIDFRKVLSTSTYSELIKNILDTFEASGKELNTNDVWKAFHQNNWNNASIVPKAPKWVRFKDNKAAIYPDSSLSANDFILKTVKKPGLSREQITQLVKAKRGREAFDNILLEKQHPQMANGKWLYIPVNKLGDGNKLTEIPIKGGKSIIESNNIKGQESSSDLFTQSPAISENGEKVGVDPQDVIQAYNEEGLLNPILTPLAEGRTQEEFNTLIQELKDKGIIDTKDCK